MYKKSMDYWSHIQPTNHGMLGGYEMISQQDSKGSLEFLHSLSGYALDCGAGIGRVSLMLIQLFDSVDLLEQDSKFIQVAKAQFAGNPKIIDFYNVGLQDFCPSKQYDLIWNQWVLGYLTDDDLVAYLIRCKSALTADGHIGVKENISLPDLVFDEQDSSWTRSDSKFKDIFHKAGLKIVKEAYQDNFPPELFKVKMYLLSPRQH